jgi:hypothetical protein
LRLSGCVRNARDDLGQCAAVDDTDWTGEKPRRDLSIGIAIEQVDLDGDDQRAGRQIHGSEQQAVVSAEPQP